MKFYTLALIITLTSLSTHARVEVIYGKDNRLDIYEITSSFQKTMAQSTAGMISVGLFKKAVRQSHFDLITETLEDSLKVCPSEKFAQQQKATTCSGFLVGPDILVTAGHCLSTFGVEKTCKSFAWVFGYEMTSENHYPHLEIPINNVYLCNKVIESNWNSTLDYAIIKLDRPVVGRKPLHFRKFGKVSDSASLTLIGHPSGLPTKVASGGNITHNENETTFSSTIDAFNGNSGSVVFDTQTGLVEGILINGKTDYILSKKDDPKSCMVANICDELGNNCAEGDELGPIKHGERVLRITAIASKIQEALNTK